MDAVVAYLAADGWEILSTARTGEHGVDILARRGERRLAVEAKGGGSARPSSRRFGQPFTSNQKRDHVAVAVLTALQVVSRGGHLAAIAFPDDPDHVQLIETIRPALATAGVCVFLIAGERSVRQP